MDELDELLPRRRIDYQRLAIQMLNLVSIVLFLSSLSIEDNLGRLGLMGIAAVVAWGALVLSIRYRTKAKNPLGALVSLVVSLIVAVALTIIFFYQYAAVGGISGLT